MLLLKIAQRTCHQTPICRLNLEQFENPDNQNYFIKTSATKKLSFLYNGG